MRIRNRAVFLTSLLILLILGINCENPEEPDTISPSIDLISPSDGSTVFEITPIKVNVSDNEGIDRVAFYIGAQLTGTISNEPYTYYWNTTAIEDGSIRTIQCRAYDTSDNEAISPSITVNINNEGRDPAPVSLPYQTDTYKYKVELTWTKSTDIDFNQYLIQKADSISFDNIWDCIDFNNWPDYNFDDNCVNTWSIIHTVNSSADTTYSDTSVTLANYYVYKITVLDSADLSSDSNIRYFSTRNVESLPITNLNINNELSVEVEWQQSSEIDFLKYELYRYEENDNVLLLTTHNVSEISYVDENTTEFVSYSYFIRHYDTKLNSADGTSESISVHLSPATLEVPSEIFPTIQSALNAAEPSDIVLVNDGIYYENLIFPDKNNVKLKSVNGPELTIIDGSRNGTVITVRSYDSVMDTTNSIEGFTIQNAGYVDYNTDPNIQWDRDGGGISLEHNANILVKNNVIKDNYNSCGGGGGIYSYQSSPIIVNNIFIENVAGISPNGEWCGNWYGGGIMAYYGSPQIMNCVFKQNKAQHEGGAMRVYETENTKILNCVFFDNQLIGEWNRGSVIEGYGSSMVLDIINCIFWNSNS
ncbi:MAG: hypothetical protein ISS11_04655, partial [Candidatus Marinimicrobia bacterium]|nr:hypothetical protein [Candidatus Neomarinimicrobiota bacterium]